MTTDDELGIPSVRSLTYCRGTVMFTRNLRFVVSKARFLLVIGVHSVSFVTTFLCVLLFLTKFWRQ